LPEQRKRDYRGSHPVHEFDRAIATEVPAQHAFARSGLPRSRRPEQGCKVLPEQRKRDYRRSHLVHEFDRAIATEVPA
jgi:hypothetical protein